MYYRGSNTIDEVTFGFILNVFLSDIAKIKYP